MLFNLVPAYRRSGGRICFISEDWKEVHIRLGLNWATRNYVGTVFGGSIYAALDPVYMIQLIHILGNHYVVWDQAAHIRFIRPVRGTVYARFLIEDALLTDIREAVKQKNETKIEIPVSFADRQGVVYAKVVKTIYIADKAYYNQKLSSHIA